MKLHVDQETRSLIKGKADGVIDATDEDYATEYLDLEMAVRIVDGVDEAVNHITTYGTGHSEAILTRNLENSRLFAARVDAACVYINASTRFTDGGQFGMGAGNRHQHAEAARPRPAGPPELTSVKYVITGDGQVRG